MPPPGELARLAMPVLVVVAARSRAHDPVLVARRAAERLPDVRIETLAGAAHHTIPTEDVDELVSHMAGFLAPGTPGSRT